MIFSDTIKLKVSPEDAVRIIKKNFQKKYKIKRKDTKKEIKLTLTKK